MSYNATNVYDFDSHIGEVYDAVEDYVSDVDLIRNLVGDRTHLRILEPFCGTGRIAIPLAQDGHELVGLDQAKWMLAHAHKKIDSLPHQTRQRITLARVDAVRRRWPSGFDLVILGANCLYELGTPLEQERCVEYACAALKPGGYVYIDNNHMEGELDESWQRLGMSRSTFPSGTCADGTRMSSKNETVWFDAAKRLVRFRRCTHVDFPDGSFSVTCYTQQKHPVSTHEVRVWLERHGFVIEGLYGDRSGGAYCDESTRAIFWARKIDGGQS